MPTPDKWQIQNQTNTNKNNELYTHTLIKSTQSKINK